jgi:3-isopropylmalate/(R)-2-methylmalate dehydratase small subunit
MSMEPIRKLESRTVLVAGADIDTDQIIPARFLKGTTRAGLGKHLFAEWRDFPRDDPAQVLVAGRNFGCGSSREHAPWALLDHGFRAVISSSIADIFRANALKNGLLPVVVDEATHRRLLEKAVDVVIDLETRTLAFEDVRVSFPIDPFARRCLLEGKDELEFLLAQEDAIAAHEKEAAC